jgi:Na+:H+ antiporter, NhaA family
MKPPSSGNTADQAYPLERLFGAALSPLERFLRQATAGGIVLVATTLLTLVIANSDLGEEFGHFWELPAGFTLGEWAIQQSLHHWVNDGLMALFFLLVGLELKREALVGELASLKDAALPIFAAAGGMLVPALIYLALNPDAPAARGWGVPMATDIAFAIGILVLLASRIPRALIVFLMALAIADDLGAVLVIALFYTADIDQGALLNGAIALGVLVLLNRGGVRARLPYWLVGLLLWYFTALSGIHATVAGVLLAFTLPVRPKHTASEFEARVTELLASFRQHAADPATPSDTMRSHDMATIAAHVQSAAQTVQSPLQRTEHGLGAPVTFLILPVFALANAGVDFRGADLLNSLNQPITLGITLGLVLGKFIGIGGFSWLAVKFGIARLPSQVKWMHLLGAAWLGGIGFTMSLFIAQLGFTEPEQLEQAKVGILLGSLVAALLGLAWLLACTGKAGAVSSSADTRS